MDILDKIEPGNEECFPVMCPICGKRDGHLFLYKPNEKETRGGVWTWCSACHNSIHASFRIPEWWRNPPDIIFGNLAAIPDYLEDNKMYIDQWMNRLLFSKLLDQDSNRGSNKDG